MLTGSWTQVKSLTCKAWLVLIRFEKGLIDEKGFGTWKNATHGLFKDLIFEADFDPIDYDGGIKGFSIELVAKGKDEDE